MRRRSRRIATAKDAATSAAGPDPADESSTTPSARHGAGIGLLTALIRVQVMADDRLRIALRSPADVSAMVSDGRNGSGGEVNPDPAVRSR